MNNIETIEALLGKAHCHLKNGQVQAALAGYLAVLQVDEKNPIALYNAGLCYRKLNNWAVAEKTFMTLAAMGTHPLVMRQLADMAFLQNHHAIAMDYYQQALALQEGDHALYFNLATCYLHTQQSVMANFYYQRALLYDNNDSETHFNLGVIAQQQQAFDKAITHYIQAIEKQPQHYPALMNMGACYLKLAQVSEATAVYRQVLEINPQAEQVRFTLAALEGKQVERAPAAYLIDLFDRYADNYDANMENQLDYQLPALVVKALTAQPLIAKHIIELGCGTGLMGKHLAKGGNGVIGIDLSYNMLAKARATHCYESLICGDFMTTLATQQAVCDAIIAADVFVYLGDLTATLALCHDLLLPGGIVLFNTEITTAANYYLQQSGRYAHHHDYITALAYKHHFAHCEIVTVPIRSHLGEMVFGYWVKLVK